MPSIKVAHVQEQGQQMVLIPLAESFGYKPPFEQSQIQAELQQRVSSAGLAGTVVLLWPTPGGGSKFMGPQPWHPFLRGLSLSDVYASLNKEISWV